MTPSMGASHPPSPASLLVHGYNSYDGQHGGNAWSQQHKFLFNKTDSYTVSNSDQQCASRGPDLLPCGR